MSFAFGNKKSSTTSTTKGERDPWEPTIPYLEDFLRGIGNASQQGVGANADQSAAFDALKTNAQAGNPWTDAQGKLATDLYDTADRAGMVGDAYTKLQAQIGDYANGKYVDPMQNPQIRAMLTQVGDDIANRTNAAFAGAGRDLSGANQQAVAKGVSQGTLALLLDQYNRGQQQQLSAAQTLYGAAGDTASTQAGLDAQRAQLRTAGATAGQTALDMKNYAPNAVLELAQQQKQLPYEDLATIGSVLFPVAGLGEQQQQTGNSTTKQNSFGLGLNLLSDERAKEDKQEIGKLADGTPLYRYVYKGDPTKTVHVGLLAQDVDDETPEAVTPDQESGLLTVNMDAATRKAADIMRKRKGGK